jgi:alpha-tubulin suppressor-like RCC1 family protein
VSAGLHHSCALVVPGQGYCWGENAYGALGNHTNVSSNVPVPAWGGHSFRTISAGSADTTYLGAHSCALDGSGTAYCWGLNNAGQLGYGFTFAQDTAHPIASAEKFKAISAGKQYSCAVTVAGAALCWGEGASGKLGNGSFAGSLVPVAVSGGLTFAMISAGDVHTCGVTMAGDIYCWGNNAFGQLGLGTQGPPQLAPQFVMGGFQWVSAGAFHTCGVQISGQVYCWGRNQHGQLGDGTQITRSSPVAVGGGLGTGFRRVDVGGRAGALADPAHSCGVKISGDAYCWGANASGQLGNGGSPGFVYVFPSLVMGGYSFRNVSAGVDHSCGVTHSGAAYCWGSAASGALGNGGGAAPFATPVLVSGGHVFH